MAHLHWLEYEVREFIRANRYWMAWNLVLAAVPAAMALWLFRPERRHDRWWWFGVLLFALFLPNAPYVVSDLRYLHGSIVDAASRSVVVAGVLPLYAIYVALGFVCYFVAVRAALAELARWRPTMSRLVPLVAIHCCCAIGVFLGRVGRLNSWNTFDKPFRTLSQTDAAFKSPKAPADLVIALASITIGYALVALAVYGLEAGYGHWRTNRRPLPHAEVAAAGRSAE